jgi:TPR repeat protein
MQGKLSSAPVNMMNPYPQERRAFLKWPIPCLINIISFNNVCLAAMSTAPTSSTNAIVNSFIRRYSTAIGESAPAVMNRSSLTARNALPSDQVDAESFDDAQSLSSRADENPIQKAKMQASSSTIAQTATSYPRSASVISFNSTKNVPSTFAGAWTALHQPLQADPSRAHTVTVAAMCATADKCKRLCIDDDDTMSNSKAMQSVAQGVLDFCADHKSRLIALEFHVEIERAVTTLHATLSRAASVLEQALQTSWRRNGRFKSQLAPLISEAQGNLTSLGTSLSFAALELGPDGVLGQSASADDDAAVRQAEQLILQGDRAYFGHGAPQSYDQAFRAYEQAAKLGHPTAMNSLAGMLSRGLGCQIDMVAATSWLESACATGDAEAMNSLALILEHDNHKQRAMQLYRQAADVGHAEAQTNLGFMYEHGVPECHIDSNDDVAMAWYKQAAIQNNARAQNNYGFLLHRHGQSVEAVKWFKLSAAQGHAAAQNNLGICYETGANDAVRVSLDIAAELYEDAAKQGHMEATTNLGYVLLRKKEYQRAIECFAKAVEHGSPAAMFHMGQIYEYGLGVDKSADRAFYYFDRAARLGHSKAQVRAGNCNFAGLGTARDVTKAFEWYKKAAAAGSDDGKNQLGLLFLHGIGTEQDYEQARHWFESASNKGDGNASFNLAGMYQHGAGVAVDAAAARRLMELARDQGSDVAKKYLAEQEAERKLRESVMGHAADGATLESARTASQLDVMHTSTDVAFRILRSNNFKLL